MELRKDILEYLSPFGIIVTQLNINDFLISERGLTPLNLVVRNNTKCNWYKDKTMEWGILTINL